MERIKKEVNYRGIIDFRGEQKYERNTSVDTLSYIKKKESTIKNLSNFFREIFILLNINLERLLR